MDQIKQGRCSVQYSMDLLGTPSFLFWATSTNGKWCVFSNVAFRATPETPISNHGEMKFFHGTSLSTCYKILSDQVFRVGLFRKIGSKDHPTGIWGCSHPGHSLHRSPLDRSWSYTRPESKISQWDLPVAMLLPLVGRNFRKVQRLADGHYKLVIPYPADTRVPIVGPMQVWINREMYDNFGLLNARWHCVANGSMVACRAPEKNPFKLYRCGDAHPMTCGRSISRDAAEQHGWTRAKNSREWVCPQCTTLCINRLPLGSSLSHTIFT